jgi:hypothetical protein
MIAIGTAAAEKVISQLAKQPGMTESKLAREGGRAAFAANGLPEQLNYVIGTENPAIAPVAKAFGLMQIKGSGTLALRSITELLGQLGIPGLNTPGAHSYGGNGIWANINTPQNLPANYAGLGGPGAGVLMGASQSHGWGKGGFNPAWASNAALGAAASLQLSPEDARKIYNQFVTAYGGGSQEQALMSNQAAFIRGGGAAGGGQTGKQLSTDQSQYLATIKDILVAYNDLVPAIDAAALAGDAFNKDGQLQIAALGRAVKDAQTAIPAEMNSAIDVLLSGGTKYTAMRAAGAEAGKVFLDAFKTDLLQSDVFSKFMTKGSVELSQAAAAYASGDTAGGKTLATKAIADVKKGSKQFVDFMALIAPSLRGLETSLGATPLARSDLINQTSLGLPSFDTGGIVPHTGPAIVHQGELVSTPGQMGDVIDAVNRLPGAFAGAVRQLMANGGGTVNVTVSLDPRELDRATRDNVTFQRTGMSYPRQIGTKVRR